jgi:hypothetical protein
MGSGSGDFTLPSPNIKDIERKVQSQLNEAERFEKKTSTRNVFISFHSEDEWAVNLLRSQAKDQRFDVSFRDYSIKEPFDSAWKSQAKDIIDQTSVMIVMIGEDTASREAVNWEIREAHKQGKRVIGVRIHKDANHEIPDEIKNHGDPVINWSIQELQKLLK